MNLAIDPAKLERQLFELAAHSEVPAPAVTRVLFSETDLLGRAYVKRCAEDEGLTFREDAVGNLFFRWEGTEPDLPAVATGSHTDAIPNAGMYDGTVGVLGGIAALAALREAGFQPRRSLEVIMFTAEEPTRFGLGCLGSRMMAGVVLADQARALRDPDGRSLEELRTAAGCTGNLESVRLWNDSYAAFVELHIEQGPLLEREGLTIGLVEAIAGPSSYRVTFYGEGGHAGAVLMPDRHDAALAAAEVALAVERTAKNSGSPDTVATTGVWRVKPGAINSVPDEAQIEIDLRDTCLETREKVLSEIREAMAEICRRRGVMAQWEQINEDRPGAGDDATIAVAEKVCEDLAITCRRMVSRAYHDTLFMTWLCPATMIFIPCCNGWSHRPEEYAEPGHIAAGTLVLAHTLARLAE